MDERGAVHLTLVALLFGGVVMLGLAVDMTRLGIAWRELAHVAAVAAEAGAGWIDEGQARQDRVVIDRDRARTAAWEVAGGEGRRVRVTIRQNRICVRLQRQVRPTLLNLVGAASKTLTATSCAEPRKG